jgi:hypothetical protein
MRIYLVVSVAQLQPYPEDIDLSGKIAEARQVPVALASDKFLEFEIERFLGRRADRQTREKDYLVRWKGWASAHNRCYHTPPAPTEADAGAQPNVITRIVRVELPFKRPEV